jgi:spermidine synthase
VLLGGSVFITGASVLILEVVAVRILSPYYGNTIFTVSSVISVILLALSVGYYVGGALADRRPSLEWFFSIILAGGVLLLAFHLIGIVTLPKIGPALSIVSGPLVSAGLLFLAPALLLGAVAPYAVKLHSLAAPNTGVGRTAGAIFFWSTLGSITGSLLAGFVLIPRVGIDRIIIGTALVLVLLGTGALVALRARRTRIYAASVTSIVVFGLAWWIATPVDAGVVYVRDGVYQKITIYEGAFVGRPARFLLLDRSESGATFLDSRDPTDLVYDYTKYHSLYKIFAPRLQRALVLGGGSYSVPKALLKEAAGVEVDVAEIEPSLFDLAKQYFGVTESPRLHNHVQDGRRFLQETASTYDLIFGDVYYSYFSVPPQFTTHEFFTLARARLNRDGVFIANMIGDLSRRQPSLIMAELRTFRDVFPNSYFFAVESPEKTALIQNITLVGYNSNRRIDITSPPVTTNADALIRFLRYKQLDVRAALRAVAVSGLDGSVLPRRILDRTGVAAIAECIVRRQRRGDRRASRSAGALRPSHERHERARPRSRLHRGRTQRHGRGRHRHWRHRQWSPVHGRIATGDHVRALRQIACGRCRAARGRAQPDQRTGSACSRYRSRLYRRYEYRSIIARHRRAVQSRAGRRDRGESRACCSRCASVRHRGTLTLQCFDERLKTRDQRPETRD